MVKKKWDEAKFKWGPIRYDSFVMGGFIRRQYYWDNFYFELTKNKHAWNVQAQYKSGLKRMLNKSYVACKEKANV